LKAWSTQLQFELDPNAHRVVVSIVDAQSGDVIRTVPSDAVIRVAKMIVKLQVQAVETTA
jgi:flagellar protein FlaG